MSDVTQILSAIEGGDSKAAEKLLPLVYDELRKLAARKLAQESPGQTLQATALVHEAYLRLVDVEPTQKWNSRGHFFGAAAEAMRRILIDLARRKQSAKREGAYTHFSIADQDLPQDFPIERILEIDELMEKLTSEDPVIGELVKLRVFAGLSIEEAALALSISRTTAFRHWTYARAWLRAEWEDDE